MGETSIFPSVASNNKPVRQIKVDAINNICSLNGLIPVLISGQVRVKALLSITPIVMLALEFGGDSASRYHNKYFGLIPLGWSEIKPFGFVKLIDTSSYL